MIGTVRPGIAARVGRAFGMFDYRRGSSQQVWIAGGIGITPFRSWIHAFPTEQPLEFDIDLYYTVHNEDEVLFLDELRTAEAHYPTFRPHITYSKREGSLTMEHIASRSRGPLSEKEVYMCGPDKMIQHFQRAFQRRGMPSHHIHYEYFNFR